MAVARNDLHYLFLNFQLLRQVNLAIFSLSLWTQQRLIYIADLAIIVAAPGIYLTFRREGQRKDGSRRNLNDVMQSWDQMDEDVVGFVRSELLLGDA